MSIGLGFRRAATSVPAGAGIRTDVLLDKKVEMPGLWYPGRKPVGNVKIDWNNPLTKSLEIAYLYGNKINLVTQKPLTTFLNPLTLSAEAREGIVSEWDRGTDNHIIADYANNSVQEHSCFLRARHRALIFNQSEAYAGLRGSSNNSFVFSTTSASGTFPNQTYKLSYAHGGIASYTSTSIISNSNTNFVSVGFSAKVSDEIRFFNEGKLLESIAIGSINNNNDKLVIGADPAFNASFAHYESPIFLYFSRKLRDEEMRNLHKNPYQFLIPA